MSKEFDKLRRRALGGRVVDVEDVVGLLLPGDPDDAPRLRELAKTWPTFDSAGHVPLQDWGILVADVLEAGPERAVEAASRRRELVPLAVGVLESVPSVDAVRALVRLGRNLSHGAGLDSVLLGLNQLLSFDVRRLPEETSSEVRDFIHESIATLSEPAALATAFLALRSIGDEQSIGLLEGRQELPEPWRGVRRLALSKIRARMSQRTG